MSGALLAALAVVLGAFGAHALKSVLTPEKLLVFDTGVKYQFYHSLALLIVGIIYAAYPVAQLRWSVIFFIVGIALFSGSLYAICLLSAKGISIGPAGILTPLGGLFFIAGWLSLFAGLWVKP